MPVGTTALPVAQRQGTAGKLRDLTFTPTVVSPGHNFVNSGRTYLVARNTQVGAGTILFEAHILGVERTIETETIPGSATDSGIAVVGPFDPALFNNHGGVDGDRVYVRQSGGANGDLQFAPFEG